MLSRVWAIRGRLFGSPSVVFARCPHRRAGQRLDVVPASLGRHTTTKGKGSPWFLVMGPEVASTESRRPLAGGPASRR